MRAQGSRGNLGESPPGADETGVDADSAVETGTGGGGADDAGVGGGEAGVPGLGGGAASSVGTGGSSPGSPPRPRGHRLLLVAALVLGVALPAVILAGQLTAPPQVEGTVVAVHADGPLHISSFTIRTADGQVLDFAVGNLQIGGPYFDAPHLAVHAATGQPIVVTYEIEGGRRVAIRLADAPGSTAPPASPTGAAGSPPGFTSAHGGIGLPRFGLQRLDSFEQL
jgi:hypothetical protein